MIDLGFQANYQRPHSMLNNVLYVPRITGVAMSSFLFRDIKNAAPVTDLTDRPAGLEDAIGFRCTRKVVVGRTFDDKFVENANANSVVYFENQYPHRPLYLSEELKIGSARYRAVSEIKYGEFEFEESVREEVIGGDNFGSHNNRFRLALGQPDAENFLLSNYGFPEPAELRRKTFSNSTLVVIAGLLAVGFALFLRTRVRRSSGSAARTT